MPTIRTPGLGLVQVEPSGLQPRERLHTDENFTTLDTYLSAMRPAGAIAESIPRETLLAQDIGGFNVSGTLDLFGIKLMANVPCNAITFLSGATALSVGTHQFFGLYDATSFALLRGSVDDGATAWAANTPKTLALTSQFTPTKSGLYYVGFLVTATTVPTLRGAGATATNHLLIAPQIAGPSSTGLSALPATAGAFSASMPLAYIYIT